MPLSAQRIAELDAYYARQSVNTPGAPITFSNSPDKEILDVFTPDQGGGLTPERIAELDAYYATQNTASVEPQPNGDGFFDRVGAGYAKRKNQMQTIADQYVDGDISKLEADARMGLKYAQILPDVVGEGLVSGFRALPDAIETPIRQGASNVYSAVADTLPGRTIGLGLDLARGAYSDLEKSNPVAAGRLSSVVDAGNLAAGFVPIKGTSAVAAAGDAATDTAKAAASGIKKAGGAAVNAVAPTIEEGMRPVVALAQKYKIPVALHQVSQGNALKNFQKVSKELPFSGEAAFREKQMGAFNRALISTTGGNANKFTPELMDNLFRKVGGEFDAFGKGKQINLNDKFAKSTEDLLMEIEEIAPEAVGPAMKRIQKIYASADANGVITGEKLAALRKETSRLARKTGNPDIASAFQDIENAIVDSITAGDKNTAEAFAKTKQRYKNLLVIEPLAQKAKGGNISPAQLQARVAKIYNRSFTRGQAGEIGDLARIGNEILPEIGGSDTVQKALYAGGAGGLGITLLMNPALALGGVANAGLGLGANRLAQAAVNRNQALLDVALNKSRLQSIRASKSPPASIVRRP